MEVFPSEYQKLELSRSEKLFVRYASIGNTYGFLLLLINPAMQENESLHALITSKGILFFKFFDTFSVPSIFSTFMETYRDSVIKNTMDIIGNKLSSNKALVDKQKRLLFPVGYICVFPNVNREECIMMEDAGSLKDFVECHCLFAKEFSNLRTDLINQVNEFLDKSFWETSDNLMEISDNNISSIIQRIAPEYVTVRIGRVEDEKTKAGADNKLLVVDEKDISVKAFMLDQDQINIINKINKGDQLILACAGSGKSVLLIAKCFKAARMNPDKKFLITCYNRNLQSLYTWFIDRAGLKERNVECITFHMLCKKLLLKNHIMVPYNIDSWAATVAAKLYNIKDRYYGIFIDEVQMFEQDWYKICFNLLENKDSDDHLFVICGDKTQKIKNQQKHGRAPWNVGDGYPNYRGGNKNIRIEKNYRNCIEINEYINRFVDNAKKYISQIYPGEDIDPDMFLRGKAVTNGIGVKVRHLKVQKNNAEAQMVVDSVVQIHDENKIPYDEIAIVIFNKSFRVQIDGWQDEIYNLEAPLISKLASGGIPFSMLYSKNSDYSERYGVDGGISLISTESVLGLDFRAVVVCGLKPLGFYDKTKTLKSLSENKDDSNNDIILKVKENISQLYVACTRAKEVLHIILPEDGRASVYMKMIEESE